MDIILLQKVANLGQIGDRVKVKSGYARNFLVPTGRATMATAANIAKFEAQRGGARTERTEPGWLPIRTYYAWHVPKVRIVYTFARPRQRWLLLKLAHVWGGAS